MVKGSTLNAEGRIAYVATGAFGLAIVDAMDFKFPIVLSQLDLAGDATDVDVDPRLNIAAVATAASGLAIVDVTDPSNPQLIRTIAGHATQVEVFEGVAYTNQGSDLRAYDLLTGERLQSLALNGGNITGIAREGSVFYTMDDSRILRRRSFHRPGGGPGDPHDARWRRQAVRGQRDRLRAGGNQFHRRIRHGQRE